MFFKRKKYMRNVLLVSEVAVNLAVYQSEEDLRNYEYIRSMLRAHDISIPSIEKKIDERLKELRTAQRLYKNTYDTLCEESNIKI